jgi:cyclin B
LDHSNRHRLLDWLMQVFGAFKLSSQQTFVLGASILDRYLVGKYEAGERLSRETLPLTALATILISSKYEDVVAISAQQLVEKAGHGKFSLQQLIEKELDILMTLKFHVSS